MHMPDGILTTPILTGGFIIAGAGIAYGLRKMENEDIPKTAVLTAAFFVCSLIHIPVPPSSVHLLLPGLMGMLLGWNIFPAVFAGLLIQYITLGHGGVTTLGINTVIIATPGLLCHLLLGRFVRHSRRSAFFCGLIAGVIGVALCCAFFAVSLYLCGDAFAKIAGVCLFSHIPVAFLEGLVTAFALSFILIVRPRSMIAYPKPPSTIPEGVIQ